MTKAQPQPAPLPAHAERVLELLHASDKPLVAYDILEKLRHHGVKAPPTVYRALDALVRRGLAHRVESLNAYVACHTHHTHEKASHFAVCRACGGTTEIHNHQLIHLLEEISNQLNFKTDNAVLELLGTCAACARAQEAA